ncbi:MAG: dynamin family protein [Rhodocyclaceae bacterium]|nr:dynamin family protein [Rhodocyclaceae bacterium]
MSLATLDPTTAQQRYGLLCRALQATPGADDPQPVLDTVSRLDDLIHRELLELARLGSPDDFADIYLGFSRELARFREFCADPRLAEKTVVAFGGPFSAGKSSLINVLIGKHALIVEVDPTTALPAYVLAGEEDAIHALNLHRLRVPITDDEFASLTHDEVHRYGSQVARAFSAAFVTRRDFPWASLAIIDTPGYTGRATAGDRSDADLAAAQLAGAHAIVWVTSIKQGNLSEEDLAFLARLDPSIPRLIVASHADQLTDSDRSAVIELMRDTLAARNLPVLGVFAVSARPRQAELLAPLRAQLDAWNRTPRQQRFAHRFKALFIRYQRGLEREASAARWQLHRINRIAILADGELANDATELKTVIDERLAALKTVESRLHDLRGRFFGELKRAGDTVGIPLPEPHEVELLEPGRSNLLEQLVALREQEGREEPDMGRVLTSLRKKCEATHRLLLTRRFSGEHFSSLAALRCSGDVARRPALLRRPARPMSLALKLLQKCEATHRLLLTRRFSGEHFSSLAALRCSGDVARRPALLRRPARPMSLALKLLQH